MFEKLIEAARTCYKSGNPIDECCIEGCPNFDSQPYCLDQILKDCVEALTQSGAELKDKDYLIQQQADEIGHLQRDVKKQQDKMIELAKRLPHWVSVEERKPPEYTDVWCAVYTTDLIYVEDGETVEEAIENRQLEAARNPRVTLGSYSDDEGWTDGYFGMPMVCQPDYWLEMTIPEPPKEVQDADK